MPVDIATISVAFALLAPVYGLLFNIQREIGGLKADHDTVRSKLENVEDAAADSEAVDLRR